MKCGIHEPQIISELATRVGIILTGFQQMCSAFKITFLWREVEGDGGAKSSLILPVILRTSMSRFFHLPVTISIMRGTSLQGQARSRKPAACFIFQYAGVSSAYSRGCEGKMVSGQMCPWWCWLKSLSRVLRFTQMPPCLSLSISLCLFPQPPSYQTRSLLPNKVPLTKQGLS